MRTPEARVPTGQLVRSSASVAANYQSSCRARSKKDFIAKLGTVIEESDESLLWLEYLAATALLSRQAVNKLLIESNELVAIFTKSQKTARSNYAREKKCDGRVSAPPRKNQRLRLSGHVGRSIQQSAIENQQFNDSAGQRRFRVLCGRDAFFDEGVPLVAVRALPE
jgi:four helix bundle protein